MLRSRPWQSALALALALVSVADARNVRAQRVPATTYQQLSWRMIGPFRGGRTVAAVGAPGHPATLYIGVNNGGVWRSTDYGRVWQPIFDDQPTGSIGAIAIAPSNPKIVYVGSGEGLQRPDLSTGDGIYRSDDGGDHWTHLGLRDGQQIPAIVVDPRDPDRLLVAVLGHPYGPNPERGIFKSSDGGRTFRKVLYRDEDTGGMDLALDPANPDVVYADMWAARLAPWEVSDSYTESAKNGLWKSTDGGEHWRQLTKGLPGAAEGLGRIGIAVAPSDGRRLYAILGKEKGGGLYRSDDSGESWALTNRDERLWGRDGDFNEVKVDPRNPDVVYVANIVAWKSTDGGRTFHSLRGAPGGDDYHRFWIDPTDPNTILLASDQGAVVSQNGGRTWSSWYNQPSAQFYHVATDNAFPYRVCGGQQESGSACVASRGDAGEITFWEWHPVGAEEYAYVAPDPLDPDIVYGDKVTRYDRRSGQTLDVTPRPLRSGGAPDSGGVPYRVVRTQPLLFAPTDPHTLYFASNTVWKTGDGGDSWQRISPDLTRPALPAPANLGTFTNLDPEHGRHRGVIYTLAPSYVDGRTLWAGTDDGLIQVTGDGGAHWSDVTPPALRSRPWAKISLMDAGRFDAATAYAAVNTFRLDDLRPHIFRTHDGGRNWTEIVSGLPEGAIVNVVREDPVRRGLLYAGSETGVWLSFDDGDHWQSLRLNMPATSIRDLVVKDSDLVAGTHGRGIWILDRMTALRELQATSSPPTTLFTPAGAVRVRFSNYTDTPLPADEPMAPNPPDGAPIDYFLAAPARSVTLEIREAGGGLVRRYQGTEADQIAPRDTGNVPWYWVRPPQTLETSAGAHRLVWDLRYPTPPFPSREFPISAVPGRTPLEPRGPLVPAGRYSARLIVDGVGYTRQFDLRMDPRVKTPMEALNVQFVIAVALAEGLRRDSVALGEVRAWKQHGRPAALDTVGAGLAQLAGELQALYEIVEAADVAPTTQAQAAIRERLSALDALLARWSAIRERSR
jgi:photosystem II stability/assembly factor-like uncharacterized protein